MIKRILVATDASEYSRHALSVAIEYAKQFHSEIELLHVVYPPHTYDDYSGGYSNLYSDEKIDEIGKPVLEETLKGLDVSQVTIKMKIVKGHPATAILDEIRRDFDLVVMGSHGYGKSVGAITGSVIQHVLADAHCPVLVVK